jgi:anti-sigma factor RsiW
MTRELEVCVRCSSCEPLLDRYIEGTLTPRQMIDVGAHVRDCANCRELLEEVKVIDGLLATTSVPDLPENFTFAVMAEVNSMPAPRARAHPVWSFLVLYSTAAWVAAVAGMAITRTSPAVVFEFIARAFAKAGAGAGAFAASVSHALSPSSPSLAELGFGVLLLDIVIAAAFAVLYFVVRPRVVARFASVPEIIQ